MKTLKTYEEPTIMLTQINLNDVICVSVIEEDKDVIMPDNGGDWSSFTSSK